MENELEKIETRVLKQIDRILTRIEESDRPEGQAKTLEIIEKIAVWMDKRNTGKVQHNELDDKSIDELESDDLG